MTVAGLLIVGEQPSSPVDDDGPLAGRSGARLAQLAGISVEQYLQHRRVNLLDGTGPWDPCAATRAATELDLCGPPVPFLLLGRAIAAAFGVRARPFTTLRLPSGRTAHLAPHPSGRNRCWNDPQTVAVARAFLRPLLAA